MYTANRHNFTFLIPHPNPPPLGEGVYEKRRLCQFAVYMSGIQKIRNINVLRQIKDTIKSARSDSEIMALLH